MLWLKYLTPYTWQYFLKEFLPLRKLSFQTCGGSQWSWREPAGHCWGNMWLPGWSGHDEVSAAEALERKRNAHQYTVCAHSHMSDYSRNMENVQKILHLSCMYCPYVVFCIRPNYQTAHLIAPGGQFLQWPYVSPLTWCNVAPRDLLSDWPAERAACKVFPLCSRWLVRPWRSPSSLMDSRLKTKKKKKVLHVHVLQIISIFIYRHTTHTSVHVTIFNFVCLFVWFSSPPAWWLNTSFSQILHRPYDVQASPTGGAVPSLAHANFLTPQGLFTDDVQNVSEF